MSNYDDGFFEYLRQKSRNSAQEIVPLVCRLVEPKSVVDIGCGTATWLAVFQEHGVENVFGVDGDYVNRAKLEIPLEKFYPFDLTKPLALNKEFDLAMSLEVAEHLPAEAADTFVNSLTSLSPIIMFSAAIPAQGGVDHINEQWQNYWVEKFASQNYEVIDYLRQQVWQNDNINYWYAQNILLFVERQYLANSTELNKLWQETRSWQPNLVHPDKYLELVANYEQEYQAAQWYAAQIEDYKAAAELKNISLKKVLLALPALFKQALFRRLKKIKRKISN